MAYNILELGSVAASKDGRITARRLKIRCSARCCSTTSRARNTSTDFGAAQIGAVERCGCRRYIGSAGCWRPARTGCIIARRLVRMAIEDIGMADPRAMEQAIAGMQTVHFLGEPGRRPGAGAGCDLSLCRAEVGCGVSGAECGDGGDRDASGRAGPVASCVMPRLGR